MTQENYANGLIYPPFSNIRKISAHIAANVAAKAYELGELQLDKFNNLFNKILFNKIQGRLLYIRNDVNFIISFVFSVYRSGFASPSSARSG